MRSRILMTLEALFLPAVMLTFTACYGPYGYGSAPYGYGSAPYGYGSAPSYEGDEWYQGQRGHWYQEGNRWQWRAAEGNQPYYGQSSAQWQNRQALLNQDRRLREQYKAAFARGDKNAQRRSMELLRETDRQFGMTEQQINAGVLPY